MPPILHTWLTKLRKKEKTSHSIYKSTPASQSSPALVSPGRERRLDSTSSGSFIKVDASRDENVGRTQNGGIGDAALKVDYRRKSSVDLRRVREGDIGRNQTATTTTLKPPTRHSVRISRSWDAGDRPPNTASLAHHPNTMSKKPSWSKRVSGVLATLAKRSGGNGNGKKGSGLHGTSAGHKEAIVAPRSCFSWDGGEDRSLVHAKDRDMLYSTRGKSVDMTGSFYYEDGEQVQESYAVDDGDDGDGGLVIIDGEETTHYPSRARAEADEAYTHLRRVPSLPYRHQYAQSQHDVSWRRTVQHAQSPYALAAQTQHEGRTYNARPLKQQQHYATLTGGGFGQPVYPQHPHHVVLLNRHSMDSVISHPSVAASAAEHYHLAQLAQLRKRAQSQPQVPMYHTPPPPQQQQRPVHQQQHQSTHLPPPPIVIVAPASPTITSIADTTLDQTRSQIEALDLSLDLSSLMSGSDDDFSYSDLANAFTDDEDEIDDSATENARENARKNARETARDIALNKDKTKEEDDDDLISDEGNTSSFSDDLHHLSQPYARRSFNHPHHPLQQQVHHPIYSQKAYAMSMPTFGAAPYGTQPYHYTVNGPIGAGRYRGHDISQRDMFQQQHMQHQNMGYGNRDMTYARLPLPPIQEQIEETPQGRRRSLQAAPSSLTTVGPRSNVSSVVDSDPTPTPSQIEVHVREMEEQKVEKTVMEMKGGFEGFYRDVVEGRMEFGEVVGKWGF
ncbi:uncharacterized protein EV422DRAFT_523144 [Fimicolochytrium jonesii]|uniref:uncharacterized protein n=1 Tax=Fimicolochytrium jonesii TaxID=1396493 RepID=UPI0022FDDEAC|nr:uncharacterized protein EV422DRAFT_523144 [Fimicolochytrium jonesii]KAI8823040.1 hypothetical protein EV422DRAFT_523144 [Fimicolochytrium jonesii]